MTAIRRLRPAAWTRPSRGDLLAAVTVALVLVPQSLAYAELAGMPVVTGLCTAVAAPIAAGLIGSSRYLQTPVTGGRAGTGLGFVATTHR